MDVNETHEKKKTRQESDKSSVLNKSRKQHGKKTAFALLSSSHRKKNPPRGGRQAGDSWRSKDSYTSTHQCQPTSKTYIHQPSADTRCHIEDLLI